MPPARVRRARQLRHRGPRRRRRACPGSGSESRLVAAGPGEREAAIPRPHPRLHRRHRAVGWVRRLRATLRPAGVGTWNVASRRVATRAPSACHQRPLRCASSARVRGGVERCRAVSSGASCSGAAPTGGLRNQPAPRRLAAEVQEQRDGDGDERETRLHEPHGARGRCRDALIRDAIERLETHRYGSSEGGQQRLAGWELPG